MKTEKNILIAFLLNISFSIFEIIGGIFTNSIAIISDAIHDFGDATSIGISYLLEKKSKKEPDEKYTFGYLRYSILGALITTTILSAGSSLVIYNSILRLIHPIPINYNGMIIFAVFGVFINFIAAYFTKEGNSVNQKAVNLHMLEDVLGWIVVLIGSILMKFTNISILDSIMSIGVAVFILIHSFKNFKEILDIFLVKIPNNISIDHLKKHIMKIDGILNVHHLHVWSMDGINNYATLHIKTEQKDFIRLKKDIREEFEEHGIGHVTIEFEDKNDPCHEENCHIKRQKVSHHHHH